MDWLSQNWIWIALAVGGYLLFSRMGVGGCGMGSMRHAGSNNAAPAEHEPQSTSLFDPVSRRLLPAGATISSVYGDRAYYFESRDNRDAFESDPGKYLATAPSVGQSIGSPGNNARRRTGCC